MEENRKKTTCNRIFSAHKNTPSETGRSLVGRCNKGFTLVELIVVLIVLAIVAAIVVPALLGFNDKGKEATYKMEAQKALAATQTALSDIYNDAGNQFHPDKRKKVKELAGAGDETAFTVWTEATLRDGFTTATTENIGSYTVKEAIYKAKDDMYLLYDGKKWKVFETYNEAAAELTANKNNVIYVWPYEGKQDFAYINGGSGSGQTVSPDDDSPNIKVVDLKLDPDNKGHVYYEREGRPGSAGKEYVSIVFWKDGNTVESYWYIDALDERDRFKVDEYYTYKLHMDKGYYFAGWKNEAGEIIFDATGVALTGTVKPIDGKTYIENIIFAAGNESKKNFSFTMMIGKDDNFFDELTVDKEEFSGLITSGVKYITKVPTDDYTLEQVMALAEANNGARTDVEGAASPQMYSWVEGDTLKWWSDASVVYLPSDCSNFFKNKTGLVEFDFSDFNTIKVNNMSSMFEGCTAITDITLGTSFKASLVTSVNSMFKNCSSLTTIDIGNFDAADGALADVAYMFNGCAEVAELSFGENFNTQNISSSSDGFKSMFDGCKNATTIDVTNFNTANVTDISYMFNGCEAVTSLNLSGWNPANFTTLDHAFCNMNALVNIDFGSNWSNLTKVTTISYAFDGCILLSNDFSKFKVTGSSLTDMSCAFRNCFTLSSVDLSGWDVSKVTTMAEMFSMYNPYNVAHASSLAEVDFTGWNTGSLTDMSSIFRSCTALETIDISGWNLSKVTTLAYSFASATALTKVTLPEECELTACTTLESAFQGCTSLNQTFAELKTTSSLASIKNTFNGCSELKGLNLEGWNTSGITTTDGFTGTFIDCSLLKDIYATVDFVVPESCYSAVMFGRNTVLVGGHGTSWATEQDNTAKKAWLDRRDGRGDAKGYFIDRNDIDSYTQIIAMGNNWPIGNGKNFYLYGSTGNDKQNLSGFRRYSNSSITLPKDMEDYLTAQGFNYICATDNTFSVDHDESDPMYYNQANIENEHPQPYQVYFWADGTDIYWWSDARYAYINPKSYSLFSDWKTITEIDLTGLDFSKVENMSYCFNNCQKLTGIVGFEDAFHDNTAVTTMQNMFANCYELTSVDLSNLKNSSALDNPTALKNTQNMFGGCKKLTTVDISNLDTSSVTTMESMFSGCAELQTLDVSDFNTSSVQIFKNMFNGCTNLGTVDVSGFNTASATTMYGMFNGCSSLTALNLTQFDTGNVTDMTFMFNKCKELKSLNLSSFNTSNVTKMAAMFRECEKLENIVFGDSFDTSKVGTEDNLSVIGKTKGDSSCQSFEQMFFHCYALKSLNLSGFNTSNAHSLYRMFDQCRALETIDVSGFDTSNIICMGNMFYFCVSLEEIDISNFSSESLTDCSKMFCMYDTAMTTATNKLERIFFGEGFTCASVTDMSQMFRKCNNLTEIELTFFNTEALTNTNSMFLDCSNLETIFVTDPDNPGTAGKGFYYLTASGLERNISDSSDMFKNCNKLSGIVTSYIDKKAINGTTAGNATYACVDKTGQEGYFKGGRMPAQLVATNANWLNTYFSANKTSITRFERDRSLTKSEVLALVEAGTAKDLHDDTFSKVPVYFWIDNNIVKWWSEAFVVYINPDTVDMFRQWTGVRVIDCQGFDFSKVKSFDHWFFECKALTQIIDGSVSSTTDYAIYTDSATKMSYMFDTCNNLRSLDLSGFDTHSVTTMENMFARCGNIESIDMSSFETDVLNTCRSMFKDAALLKEVILGENFNCKKVTTFQQMFHNCKKLKSIDMSMVSTESMTNLQSVFWNCEELESATFGSDFTCEKVTTMLCMFRSCIKLTELDLRYFNTQKLVTTGSNGNDKGMFTDCSKLRTIYVTDPDENDGYGFYSNVDGQSRANISQSGQMFTGCTALVGGNTDNPTGYSSSHVNAEYARVDKDGQPGYFTAANVSKKAKLKPIDASWVKTYLSTSVDKANIGGFRRRTVTEFNSEEDLDAYLTQIGATKVDMSDPDYTNGIGHHFPVYFWIEKENNVDVVCWWSEANSVVVVNADNNTASKLGMFNGWKKLTLADLEGLDFSEMTSFAYMFADCEKLLKIYDGVSTVDYAINTSLATDMQFMFDDCKALVSIELSGFRTDNVSNMRNMFTRCQKVTSLDLTTFNTANVTDMNSMFKQSPELTKIYVSSPDNVNNKGFILNSSLSNSDYGKQIFFDCSKLEGQNGTKPPKINSQSDPAFSYTWAHIDTTDDPGYFSVKPTE
ncbi:MAG: BspA family leucine-rich repeat surface protein [Eubacterium sp.]|nr:BspA family leucine-rich repeat surface protein [Eubacterium sp.]